VTIQTTPFAPDTATDDDLVGYHAVLADAWAVDAPNDPPQPYAATVAGLRKPSPLEGPRTFWTARVDGRVVGTASVGLPDHENADVAWLRIVIHPDTRRGGVGVALARAVLPHLVASGRRTVNEQLGYSTLRTVLLVETSPERLAGALGAW
jgi:mycothiol synthase